MPTPPVQRASVAGKARHAEVLLQRYAQVQNDGEKNATANLLNELFPDIRFVHCPDEGGLTVFYLEGKVLKFPHSVSNGADLILEVRLDGMARVVKDRQGKVSGLIPGRELLAILVDPDQFPRKSRWKTIGADEDWF